VAPKGLVLDANKGFILVDAGDTKAENKPELLALQDDLNKSISKDIVVDVPPSEAEEVEAPFNIDEKFIKNRVAFSIWGMDQNITANKDSKELPFLDIRSKHSTRFSFEYQMSSRNRFSPLVGFDYSNVDFDDYHWTLTNRDSKKLLGLSVGFQYAASKVLNLYAKFGIHQDHYLDQTSTGTFRTYNLKKLALSRLSFGMNAEFWRSHKFSLDGSVGALFTFRKRLNALVIYPGEGINLEILPKYALTERKWLGLGLKIETQSQRSDGTVSFNRVRRNSGGLELKYISEF